MQMATRKWVILFSGLVLAATAQTPAKRPLNHRDYDGWRSIQSQTLSRDGKFLAYALFPEEGDGELVIRDLITGKEFRENAGSVPPAPETNFEAPAGETAPLRGLRILFTYDNRFLISNAFPKKAETDQAKKDGKPAAEQPKTSLLIVDLVKMHQGNPPAVRVPDVATYGIPENGPDFLAYLKTSAPAPTTAPAAAPAPGGDDEPVLDQGRGGRGGRGGGGAGGRRQFGALLTLRDLSTGAEKTYQDVADYVFSKDGKTFLYTVSSRKEETNGIYAIVPGTDAAPVSLLTGKGKYSRIAFDPLQKQVAFLSDHDDPGAHPAKMKVYLWDRKAAAPEIVLTNTTPGFKVDWGIADSGALSFSRDGARLFVNCAPSELLAAADRTPAAAASAGAAPAGEEKLLADL